MVLDWVNKGGEVNYLVKRKKSGSSGSKKEETRKRNSEQALEQQHTTAMEFSGELLLVASTMDRGQGEGKGLVDKIRTGNSSLRYCVI